MGKAPKHEDMSSDLQDPYKRQHEDLRSDLQDPCKRQAQWQLSRTLELGSRE